MARICQTVHRNKRGRFARIGRGQRVCQSACRKKRTGRFRRCR